MLQFATKTIYRKPLTMHPRAIRKIRTGRRGGYLDTAP
jgi:hypothetical protein